MPNGPEKLSYVSGTKVSELAGSVRSYDRALANYEDRGWLARRIKSTKSLAQAANRLDDAVAAVLNDADRSVLSPAAAIASGDLTPVSAAHLERLDEAWAESGTGQIANLNRKFHLADIKLRLAGGVSALSTGAFVEAIFHFKLPASQLEILTTVNGGIDSLGTVGFLIGSFALGSAAERLSDSARDDRDEALEQNERSTDRMDCARSFVRDTTGRAAERNATILQSAREELEALEAPYDATVDIQRELDAMEAGKNAGVPPIVPKDRGLSGGMQL